MGVLLDRAEETAGIVGVLAAVRAGLSGVVVLRGEAGIGKSALLEWAAGQAGGMQVARVAGVQAEMGMGFAGLHQLLIPFLGGLGQLPTPQRQALESAFGLADAPAPERFLVGLAALTLLTDAAAAQPVLCLIDDTQWLDQVSVEVLGFVARRLHADRAGMVFAVREAEEQAAAALAGLPDLTVGGLPGEVAGELLAASAAAPVDGEVSRQIVAGTAGNPLALVEAAEELTPGELSGTVPLSWPLRFTGLLDELYLTRVQALPADTQRLLLVAAADPSGDPALVAKAARPLGTGPEAGEAAGVQRLVSWAPRVRFRHPLIRSAAYYAAPAAARRQAHAALAEVTDPGADPDRRAWHLAEAASGPDEKVAAELERSAGRAQARGGLAAAAAFLERAMVLTPDPARRAQRALAAAETHVRAGAFGKARDLLATAEARPLDDFQSARADLLHGQIAFASGLGRDAPPLLLRAAKRLEALNLDLARQTYIDAWQAAFFAGHLARGGDLLEVSRAARALPRPEHPRLVDLVLDGYALLVTDGPAAAAPALRQATSALTRLDVPRQEILQWSWIATVADEALWDDRGWCVTVRQVQLAQEAGALDKLPILLNRMGVAAVWNGDFTAADSLIAEADAVCGVTGAPLAPVTAMMLAAFRGREAGATLLIHSTIEKATAGGQGISVTVAYWVAAVLYNSLGRYEEALVAARQASEHKHVYISVWVLPELIEAAVRTGEAVIASDALDLLTQTVRAGGTDLGLGIEARSRALISKGEAAEGHYREAIGRLGRTRRRPELARAQLLYGEWLRRQRRRRDARDQLRTAFEMFDAMGMEAFAGRARGELRATGERARPRGPQAPEVLTPQEAQIARMAAGHLSNREIAARLFISASTVEYHLHKIFRKLGITSRTQLARTLPADKGAPARYD